MIYIFDTGVFRIMSNYYPDTFPAFWDSITDYANSGNILSVKEVHKELETQLTKDFAKEWVKKNKHIFQPTTWDESVFIRKEIFAVKHFRNIIERRTILKGSPVADPFVIATAAIKNACVVTEEIFKQNSYKMPTICKTLNVNCMNFEEFMKKEKWIFKA